ncbi:Subtilase family protein [Paenibacillus sophorae]|uniref:S8 family serine peptidase n=1 Tax=Paenibacillus sophorae TaxID=1333845 RepID=A0A1H8IJI6_9BACL|nr:MULTISPECIES: S8 family serine peptidase [Paenibacillus]QWU15997.1 S8 family serine peptidase [Paenibacillus sophorae]SEN69050.1 Subtilase family protein [Paenibacillus sophorae]
MKKKKPLASLLLLMVCALLAATPFRTVSAVDVGNSQSETIFVLLDRPHQMKTIDSLLSKSQLTADKIQEIGFLKLQGTSEELDRWLKKSASEVDFSWYKDPGESAEAKMLQNRNYWDLHGMEELNAYLWYAEAQTNHYTTYDIQEGNPKVKIALLDSGVDLANEHFGQTILTVDSWNYVDGNNSVQDENGHGTQVAGVLSLLAPKISIVPYKIMNNGGGNSFALLSAIVRAANDGNQVINISAGSYIRLDDAGRILREAYQRAVDYADKMNAIIVASAGNRGTGDKSNAASNEIHAPSMLEHVISVGAVMKSNRLAPYSNYGPYIDFVAYGGYFGDDFDTTGNVNVTDLMLTAFPKSLPNTALDIMLNIPQGYSLSFGTSLAAPQVSATAALLISNYYDRHHHYPQADNIFRLLKQSAVDLGDPGRDDKFGYGEVIVDQALKLKN